MGRAASTGARSAARFRSLAGHGADRASDGLLVSAGLFTRRACQREPRRSGIEGRERDSVPDLAGMTATSPSSPRPSCSSASRRAARAPWRHRSDQFHVRPERHNWGPCVSWKASRPVRTPTSLRGYKKSDRHTSQHRWRSAPGGARLHARRRVDARRRSPSSTRRSRRVQPRPTPSASGWARRQQQPVDDGIVGV